MPAEGLDVAVVLVGRPEATQRESGHTSESGGKAPHLTCTASSYPYPKESISSADEVRAFLAQCLACHIEATPHGGIDAHHLL